MQNVLKQQNHYSIDPRIIMQEVKLVGV